MILQRFKRPNLIGGRARSWGSAKKHLASLSAGHWDGTIYMIFRRALREWWKIVYFSSDLQKTAPQADHCQPNMIWWLSVDGTRRYNGNTSNGKSDYCYESWWTSVFISQVYLSFLWEIPFTNNFRLGMVCYWLPTLKNIWWFPKHMMGTLQWILANVFGKPTFTE